MHISGLDDRDARGSVQADNRPRQQMNNYASPHPPSAYTHCSDHIPVKKKQETNQ